jgi:hypothetical protein
MVWRGTPLPLTSLASSKRHISGRTLAHVSSITEYQAYNFRAVVFRYVPTHNRKQLNFPFCKGHGCVGHRKQNVKKITFVGILYGYQLFVSEIVLSTVYE